MTNILILRLAAPMQAWGVMSRFSRRDTGKEPSKSGVVGLLCAALGISRDAADATKNPLFSELTKLEMGVRVLREGVLQSEYHTAQNIAKADGGVKETEPSTRFYLGDADFVVGLASDNSEVLETAQRALQNPKWQLFLGRKAFVPGLPIYFRDEDALNAGESLEKFLRSGAPDNHQLDTILRKYADGIGASNRKSETRQRLIIEDGAGSEMRQDVPLSFAARRFTNRRVRTEFINLTIGGKNDD